MTKKIQNNHPPIDRRRRSTFTRMWYAAIAVGALVLVCAATLLLFPDPLVNRFIKPRITQAFAGAYPGYSLRIAEMHYSVMKNRFGCDSISLGSVDSSFSAGVGSLSISGIDWMRLLWGASLTDGDFADAVAEARDILLRLPASQYELRCRRAGVAVPDSEMTVETLEFHPLGDDEQYFAASKFRETRYRLVALHARGTGVAILDYLQGKSYRVRSFHLEDVFLDVLVNKDKPNRKDTIRPLMPTELLSSIKETVQVGGLSIMNGRLKYSERFKVGAKPSWITFDSMQVTAKGIVNYGDSGAAIIAQARWKLANAGTMKLLMSIPVASQECSFKYSGSLSGMDLRPLNSFLETSDQMRITAGVLQAVTFEIDVVAGRARGTVRGIYKDLTLASIDKQTGSEKGFSNALTSFIANAVMIRRSNAPTPSDSMKIGKVAYTRKREDPFIRFVWFALRTGVQDVVGF